MEMTQPLTLECLTDRERQVVELAAQGKLNKQIAYEIGLNVGTVKTYMQNVTKKHGRTSHRGKIALWYLSQLPAKKRDEFINLHGAT
jgi:DNA-binding NarL/FixJ family response regulator